MIDPTHPLAPNVPTALLAIEAESEAAYDSALVSDFAGISAIARVILREWAVFRTRLIGTRVDGPWMEEMDRRIATLLMLSQACRSRVDLGRAANDVGACVGRGLNVYYRRRMPAAIVAMSYFGREITLDATACDLEAAFMHVGSLRTAWTGLRSAVEMTGAAARVARIEAALDAVASGIDRGDASQVLDRADALLAEVLLLEAAFDI